MSSVFSEKGLPPSGEDLSRVLGRAKGHWDAVVGLLSDRDDGVSSEWKFYGKQHGWQLKFLRKKKAVVYLIPHEKSFLAGMALREDAVASLPKNGLPEDVVAEIVGSRAYPEGKPARVEVKTKKDVRVVEKLLEIKLTSL